MMLVANFASGGFDLLGLRHLDISASLYGFFCTRSVREGVAVWATLTLNYGTKIRSNQKTCHSSWDVLNMLTRQNQLKSYRHLNKRVFTY